MTSNKGTENRKAEKGSRKKAPRVLLDVSGFPHDEKGRAIVPDDFMDENYRNLPDGAMNESRTYRAYHGGKMRSLSGHTDRDKEIQTMGANTLNANLAQRRTMCETLEDLLRTKANRKDLESVDIEGTGSTKQDAIMAAMYIQALRGNVKAAQFIRDTIGQAPITKQEISADITTEADRALMEKITKRLQEKDK
jgi:hypothetical protein